jgi:SAM-dependent methyltransferase
VNNVSEMGEAAGDDPQAYVARVMAEIEDEVQARRAAGDLPPRLERELDELFLAHAPVAGRGGDLSESLRMVDAATFVDPVVPVESNRAAGSVVKKGMRSLLLWYMGWVTHQISQFAAAVSRSLHIVEGRLHELERRVEGQHVPRASVVEVSVAHDPGAWWVASAAGALGRTPGRVLHAACGDGWLVDHLVAGGLDAYGVDPRAAVVERAMDAALDRGVVAPDLRAEDLADHLRATGAATLQGVVLSGLVDGMGAAEREPLLALLGDRLAPGGVLIVHSLSRAAWDGPDAPVEADLAPGRPLRPQTWVQLLGGDGYEATVTPGPDGDDYLVVAVHATVPPMLTPPGR